MTTESTPDAVPLDGQFVGQFVGRNAAYYAAQFKRIGDCTGFTFTFNLAAALLGSVWFGMRGLWQWFLVFVGIETFAVIQITRGVWSNLAAPFMERATMIEATLAQRIEQLAAARVSAPDKVASFESAIASLKGAIAGVKLEAQRAQESAVWLVVAGVLVLVAVKVFQGALANVALQRRFTQWRSDRSIKSGMPLWQLLAAVGLALLTYVTCAMKFGFPAKFAFLNGFPMETAFPVAVAKAIKAWMTASSVSTAWFFDGLTLGIKTVLDALEVIFVQTPWPVMGGFVILLTALSAGWRTAIFATAALAYLGYLGFWNKAMTTLALLGTAACISIALGIPLGIACARKPRLYAFVRPVLDFMQTMPAFVYLIPVIAFFGTGKPAAIVATMIFGGTPVVRLTVLGLNGVPKSVREAATAFGASSRYLLWKVDLPLAAPSIMAGINQTIMLSLAMVVIASLIGAKGLGEDVLEALQYASEGQGILAGLAILFCAMILDRIVQGRRK